MPRKIIYIVCHGGIEPAVLGRDYDFIQVERDYGHNLATLDSLGEMRAHYWVWRNVKYLDFIGFQHYRRHLWLDAPEGQTTISSPVLFASLEAKAANIPDLELDIVSACEWSLGEPVSQQYSRAHNSSHFEALLKAVPDFEEFANRESYHPCNIFYLHWSEFDRYMNFWWDLVQRLQKEIIVPDDPHQGRALAFLSERIWSFWLQREALKRPELRIGLAPLVMDLTR